MDYESLLYTVIKRLPPKWERRELERVYPPKGARPKAYGRRYITSRRVKCLYCFSGTELSGGIDGGPGGWDLVVILALPFDHKELQELSARIAGHSLQRHSKFLWGVLQEPLEELREKLLEIAALRNLAAQGKVDDNLLQAKVASVRSLLAERLAPYRFSWWYRGKKLPPEPERYRRFFYTRMLEEIYGSTPAKFEVKPDACAQLIRCFLDSQRFLLWDKIGASDSSRLLEQAFVNYGVVRKIEETRAYAFVELEWPEDEDNSVKRLLRATAKFLVTGSERSFSFKEIKKYLASPPFGLTGEVAKLYLAAVIRLLRYHLRLYGKEKLYDLKYRELIEAWRDPGNWRLEYHSLEEPVRFYLDGLCRIFSGGRRLELQTSPLPFNDTFMVVRRWWDNLPALVKAGFELPDSASALFDAFRRASGRDAADFLLNTLPAALGYQKPNKLGVELDDFLARLESLVTECELAVAKIYRRLARRLSGCFGRALRSLEEEVSDPRALDRLAHKWFSGLHPDTPQRKFSGGGEALLEVLRQDRGLSPDEVWFKVLPEKLGIKAVLDWEEDKTVLFCCRLGEAVLELETWPFCELLYPTEAVLDGKEKLRGKILEVLEWAELTKEQKERVLLQVMESVVWAD